MDALLDLRPDDIDALSDAHAAALHAQMKWERQARPNQLLPNGDWDTAIWIAGRFFGKTRCVVEPAWSMAWELPSIRVHALAPTLGDVRRVLFEGESGFLAKMPPEIIRDYNKGDKEIHLVNGSMIAGFSVVEEADRLRGPQSHHLIFDEAAAADRPAGNLEAAWRVASLGCRLPLPVGYRSRKLVATTPKPIQFLKNLAQRPGVVVIRGSSHENRANVNDAAMREVMALEGTTYGRQEIYGEFIDDDQQSIIKRNWFKLWPNGKKLPEFVFILESYDTAASEHDFDKKKQERDPSACTIWGVFNVAQCFNEQERKRMGIRAKYAALLCDCWAEHLDFPDLLERARKQHRVKYGSPGRKADITLIEDKSSGIQLRQTLARFGVPAWPFNPGLMSKTMRGHAVSPIAFQGMCFVPESGRPDRKGQPRDWVEPFLNQVCSYAGPGSVEHDDIYDTYTQAMLYLKARDLLEVTPEVPFIDAEEKRERDEAEAVRIKDRNEERINPYSA